MAPRPPDRRRAIHVPTMPWVTHGRCSSPWVSLPGPAIPELGWQRLRATMPATFLIMVLTGLPALLLQVGLPGLLRGRIGIAGPASSTTRLP